MNPKLERIIITVTLVLALIASYFTYHTITYKKSKLNSAKQLIAEFKISKALETLNKIKAKGNKDDELDSLILYGLVKAKRFEEASKQTEEINEIPKNFKDSTLEMISILSVHNQIDLIDLIVDKSYKLNLDENFFIKLSQERNSLNTEMQVLEKGLSYLNGLRAKYNEKKKSKKANEIASSKIEAFILERCIDNSNIFMGSGDYKSALFYLNKAKNLGVLKTSPLKDDYYYNLALVHKQLGNTDEAWNNMQISAKLGNERAKSMINSLNSSYVPKE